MLGSQLSSDAQFPKLNRLKTKTDFQFVFLHAKKIKTLKFNVLFTPNNLSLSRLGLVIAKKYLKKAWLRNWVKRISRESFRQHKELVKGLDIIILLRSECSLQDGPIMRAELNEVWQKLNFSSRKL